MVKKTLTKRRRKCKKKGELTDDDVCDLLQRYEAEQVLTLLHELAQSPDLKIEWNALVKKTTSGITNARECQLLWRHLAYRKPLVGEEEIGQGDQPLDDDSDLEYEVEPYPPISVEFAKEVANCVKICFQVPISILCISIEVEFVPIISRVCQVLAFGSPNDTSMRKSSVVAGDMHNGLSSNAPSSRGERRKWSYQEDLELIAAVKKCGEGYWADIAKEMKTDLNTKQLFQRWATLKRKRTLDAIGASSQLSKQLAAHRAIAMARKAGGCAGNGAAAPSNHANLNASNGNTPIIMSAQPQNSRVTNTACVKLGPMGMAKPLPPLRRAPTIPSINDPIRAAAVAAGARIASLLDAQTLFRAAQSRNAVHIIGGSSLPKNVHFIRTGSAHTRPTSMTAGSAHHPPVPGGGDQATGSLVNPTVQVSGVKHVEEVREDICAICKGKIHSECKDVQESCDFVCSGCVSWLDDFLLDVEYDDINDILLNIDFDH